MQPDNNIKEPVVSSSKNEWRKLMNHAWVVRNIPFFLFLSLIAVIYIYNGHYSDKLVRKISNTEKRIKELEFEYKTVKSQVIFRSKSSELIQAVAPLGLKELIEAPVVLGVDNNKAVK